MFRNRDYIVWLIVVTLVSCNNSSEMVNSSVSHTGALKTIMSGDISATIDLDSLKAKDNLYALGASENLKGEIQIFNGQPSNSSVENDAIKIDDSFNHKASLLVYTQVTEWISFTINEYVSKSELEDKIFELAKSNNINTEAPFPFLIEGEASSLDWHVINWKEGDTVHSHQKHKESGLNGTFKTGQVLVLGFYSTKHKAVFTHHTTNMHLHFKTIDNELAGHVDDINFNSMQIKLPKLNSNNY